MSVTKQIFIVRHGDADFNSDTDYTRELTERGINRVKDTAEFIKTNCIKSSIKIDLCISSAALRTRQTAEILCNANNITNCDFHQELYSTVTSKWIDALSANIAKNIIIVGHNPTFSQLVNNLCGFEVYMKPANCAFVKLEICTDGIIYPAKLIDYFKHE